MNQNNSILSQESQHEIYCYIDMYFITPLQCDDFLSFVLESMVPFMGGAQSSDVLTLLHYIDLIILHLHGMASYCYSYFTLMD